ncbi:MAG TPA: SprT-like domain-containing protein [Candidatus Binatia bacterium]|nr:SprT-like domain-containing protein [Candidatus Binatia bacterium]
MAKATGAVDLDEEALYAMELRLIKKHFPGLTPRPIKLDDSLDCYGLADDPALLVINPKLHRNRREIEVTLKHELIHYYLKDVGKYAGHGRDFMKRAKDLGILGSIELSQCFRLEEEENKPHRVEYVSTPLSEWATSIDKELVELKEMAATLPMNVRVKFYTKARSIEAAWSCYFHAVKSGQDHVMGEIWKPRRGPKGKPLHELLVEQRALETQLHELQQNFIKTQDRALMKTIGQVSRQYYFITDKLERDYGG